MLSVSRKSSIVKYANKLSEFVRSAPADKLHSAFNELVGGAVPTYFRAPSHYEAIRNLRAGVPSTADRQSVLKFLRWRLRDPNNAAMYRQDALQQGLLPRKVKPADVSFAKTITERASTPLVRLAHGGTRPELEQLLKRGPNSMLDHTVVVPSGRRTGVGAYFHEAPHRRTSYYANSAAEARGGSPAALEVDFPRGLLSAPNMTGGGKEHGIPPELWKYIRNPRIVDVT